MARISKIEVSLENGQKALVNASDLPNPLVRKLSKYIEKSIKPITRITEPYFDKEKVNV